MELSAVSSHLPEYRATFRQVGLTFVAVAKELIPFLAYFSAAESPGYSQRDQSLAFLAFRAFYWSFGGVLSLPVLV